MTIQEAAERVGLAPKSLCNYIYRYEPRLPTTPVSKGRRVMHEVSEEDLAQWEAARNKKKPWGGQLHKNRKDK